MFVLYLINILNKLFLTQKKNEKKKEKRCLMKNNIKKLNYLSLEI